MSLAAVIQYRTWQSASEDLRAKARALPEFEEDENEYDCLLAVDSDATLRLRSLAEAEIAEPGEVREAAVLPRGQERLSDDRRRGKRQLDAGQGEEFGTEAECSLLELVEAGLPEWVEWSRAETFTPREFRGPIAVLQEVPPECLDEA